MKIGNRLGGKKGLLGLFFAILFGIYTIFFIFTGILVSAPGAGTTFIGSAKQHYFAGSDDLDKAFEFEKPEYENVWLKVDGVTDVVLSNEYRKPDHWESIRISYLIIDGKEVNILYNDDHDLDNLMTQKLNEVSALAWEEVKTQAIVKIVIWFVAAGLFSLWLALRCKTKKTNLALEQVASG